MSPAMIPVSRWTHKEMGRTRHLPPPGGSKESTAKDRQIVTAPQGMERLRGLGRWVAMEWVEPRCTGRGHGKGHSAVLGAKPAFLSKGLFCCCK